MSISYELYEALKNFDDMRREVQTEYQTFIRNHERFKGSLGYDADLKEATAKRKEKTDIARKTASKIIDECLRRMNENAGKIAVIPPTPEMVSILQVLSLKEKISRAELDRAANAMNGNGLALSVLNDLANQHCEGIHPDYNAFASDLSEQTVKQYIRSVAKVCRDRFETGARTMAYESALHQERLHGVHFNEDDLPQKEPLESERGFYGGIIADSNLEQFLKAVNG